MAPSTATTSADISARKKLADPVATPTCARDTAFCMHTVEIGNTLPKLAPIRNSKIKTTGKGIVAGQIANADTDKMPMGRPISGSRL